MTFVNFTNIKNGGGYEIKLSFIYQGSQNF